MITRIKLDVTFSLRQLVDILRNTAQQAYPDSEIGSIRVQSYDITRLAIDETDEPIVQMVDLRHRAYKENK